MNGWVIPAPAPWAKTKHAFAPDGRDNNAETLFAASTFTFRDCGLALFMARSRRGLCRSGVHPAGHQAFARKRCLRTRISGFVIFGILVDLPYIVDALAGQN